MALSAYGSAPDIAGKKHRKSVVIDPVSRVVTGMDGVGK
jgi:hypothetical protein